MNTAKLLVDDMGTSNCGYSILYRIHYVDIVQGVATICTTHGHHNPSALPINLSTEAGSIGGVPTGGLRFGASHNAAAHMPCASMIDFYNGGGVDVACLGMAEVRSSIFCIELVL